MTRARACGLRQEATLTQRMELSEHAWLQLSAKHSLTSSNTFPERKPVVKPANIE